MKEKISFVSYVVGFVLSLILTLSVYFAVTNKFLTGNAIVIFALIFAIIQLIVQLYFFLHLGRESKPKWNLIFFLSTLSIVILVIGASIWIMANLNYNMSPRQMEEYIQSQEGGI